MTYAEIKACKGAKGRYNGGLAATVLSLHVVDMEDVQRSSLCEGSRTAS